MGRHGVGRAGTAEARAPEEVAIEQSWLEGDPSALERAHLKYRSRLEAVAYRILGERADAQDVVQKIFLSVRGASTYRGTASLWTYLYRAAVNGSVNVLRSRKRRESAQQLLMKQDLLTPGNVSSPESQVLEGEVMAEVAKALLQVKPQHRRVLTLRIMHQMTNTEIAEQESLPLATVGTWLRRGRVELQKGLKPLLKEFRRT